MARKKAAAPKTLPPSLLLNELKAVAKATAKITAKIERLAASLPDA